jgi:hypothetical protein
MTAIFFILELGGALGLFEVQGICEYIDFLFCVHFYYYNHFEWCEEQ